MEQRAPRIAAFSTTVASMSFIALLGNAFLGRYPGQEGQRVLLKPLFEGFVSGEKNDYWASTAGRRKNGFGSFFRYVSVCLQSGAAKIDPFQSFPSNAVLLNKLRILSQVRQT